MNVDNLSDEVFKRLLSPLTARYHPSMSSRRMTETLFSRARLLKSSITPFRFLALAATIQFAYIASGERLCLSNSNRNTYS